MFEGAAWSIGFGRCSSASDRDGPSLTTGGAPWRRFSSATHAAPPTNKTSPPNATACPALGVDAGRIYVDHGLTGTNRERPGLREALAACREGDTLVVTKLDRLARSLPDARAIADELTARQVSLQPGRLGLRPQRRRRPAAVQRAGHGGRVRVRPDPAAHPRRA